MKITYQSQNFDESKIARSTLAFRVSGELMRFDIDAKNWTIRESIVDPKDYPQDKIQKALELKGKAFNQVFI